MALELGLAGKTAIVSGGSAGIGLATAKALYAEGVNVAIAARDQGRLELAIASFQTLPQQGNRAIAIAVDLVQADSAGRVVDQTQS